MVLSEITNGVLLLGSFSLKWKYLKAIVIRSAVVPSKLQANQSSACDEKNN